MTAQELVAENIKYARKFSQLRWARLAARKVANGRVYKMTTCIIDKREV